MVIFFFKHKTAYELRISDWSSDVCSSDLPWTAVNLAVTGLDLLEKAKKFFYSSKTIEEARQMSAQGSARTESLQEQVRLNQQIIDKLMQQAEENRMLLEKHNDILINIEKELQIGRASCRERVCQYV